MKPILKPKDMYELDTYLIEKIGIASNILMENAAVYSSNFINKKLKHNSKILILCGVGNNGGDGLALVRHLITNQNVNFIVIGDKSKFTNDSSINYNILKSLEINELALSKVNFSEYDCIIDALLGIGSRLPLKNDLKKLIQSVNETSALKFAIDVPTGLDAVTGIADKITFQANYTLTMYAAKTGLYLNDGKDFTGKVKVLNLGIPENTIHRFSSFKRFKQIRLLKRKNNSSKFDYGKCLVIGGSKNMKGAGVMSSNAAISAGAGIVYYCSTDIGDSIFPEIITLKIKRYDESIHNNMNFIDIAKKCNTIVVGPGLGKSNLNSGMINTLIDSYSDKIIIIDADGINALDSNRKYNNNIVITPHLGEFSNLIKKDIKQILNNLPVLVLNTAKKMNINILLKGPTSLISNGEEVIFVTDGIPQMATAGSGDVLSGILGAQLNQNLCGNLIENIANSTLNHIKASKLALKFKSNIIATDIIKGLKCIK